MTPDPDGVMPLLAGVLHSLAVPVRWGIGAMRDPHDPSDQTGCWDLHVEQAEAIIRGLALVSRRPDNLVRSERVEERQTTDRLTGAIEGARAPHDAPALDRERLAAALDMRDLAARYLAGDSDVEPGDVRAAIDDFDRLIRAALSVPATGPEGLDVETLAGALGGWARHRNDTCGQDTPCEHDRTLAWALAAEYDRLRAPR